MASQLAESEKTALSGAIQNLSHGRLRLLFKAICEKVPEARQQAEAELLVAIDLDSEVNGAEKRNRYADCANCKKEFDTAENLENSCRYHPKRSEPTEEMDEDTWGEHEVDTKENREEWPERFEFECCHDTLADNPQGCVVGLHVEVTDKKSTSLGQTAGAQKTEPSTSNGKKRMMSRYAHCANCEKEFDTVENTEKSCRYHPENSEPIEEMFVDTWNSEDEIDTEDMRDDVPENFEFKCCKETLRDNPHGCVVSFHAVDVSSAGEAKRVRVY